MITNENLSEKVANINEDVEKVRESKLFRRLNILQNEIEDIKEFLVAEKYKAVTDKVMEEVTDSYKKQISDLIFNFVEDLDLEDIKNMNDRDFRFGSEVVEDQKVISDKFSIELLSDFIDSEFIKNWDEDIFNTEGHKFSMNHVPSEETLTLFLNKVKNGRLVFTIDEEELSKLEFMRTLFKRSEYREIQVIRKMDLKFEFVEYRWKDSGNPQVDITTEFEFESIKFK